MYSKGTDAFSASVPLLFANQVSLPYHALGSCDCVILLLSTFFPILSIHLD